MSIDEARPAIPLERKLYVVTRRDLSPTLRAVMAVHVAAMAAYDIGHDMSAATYASPPEWTAIGPPLLLMTTRSLIALQNVAERYRAPWQYTDPDLQPRALGAIAFYDWEFTDDRCRLAQWPNGDA